MRLAFFVIGALTICCGPAVSLTGQNAPANVAWGASVDGVQLRSTDSQGRTLRLVSNAMSFETAPSLGSVPLSPRRAGKRGQPAASVSYRFAIGDRNHAVPSGSVWLYGYGWNGVRSTKLAEINGGGVAEIPGDTDTVRRGLNPDHVIDEYVLALQLPHNVWYRSPNISPDSIWSNWPRELNQLGQAASDGAGGTLLMLAVQPVRRITLLHEDGKPVVGAHVSMSVFLYDENHCGTHGGLPLGNFVTDRSGTVSVEAPLAPLYLDDARYFVADQDGPLGSGYAFKTGLKVGTALMEAVRERWDFPGNSDLPARLFDLQVVNSGGAPLADVDVEENDLSEACGVAKGLAGRTDSTGHVRLRLAPQTVAGLTSCRA